MMGASEDFRVRVYEADKAVRGSIRLRVPVCPQLASPRAREKLP